MTILYFIITLGVLIFIHEFGHFLMAKKAGVRVERFSLGFGPRLIGIQRGETLYQVSALPLGGYVKLTGEDPTSEEAEHPKSFIRKSLWQRFKIVFAGPAMNLVLAVVLMPIVFSLGRPVPAYLDRTPVVAEVLTESPAASIGLQAGDEIRSVAGKETSSWSDVMQQVLLRPEEDVEVEWQRGGQPMSATVRLAMQGESRSGILGVEPPVVAREKPIIDEVQPGSPAAKGGLQAGDRVVAIGTERVGTWTQMSQAVQASEGQPVSVEIERRGEIVPLTIQAEWDESAERYLLGVRKQADLFGDDIVIKRYPFVQAVVAGVEECGRLAALTMQVVGRLVTFQLSYKSLGGPVRIAQASASAAQSGAADFLYFMAFLSLQLGILNLLPIPVLDGGHLFFMGLEAIRRKPVSPQVQGIAMQLGLFLLLFVMVIVTVNDVDTVWGLQEIWDKIRSLFS